MTACTSIAVDERTLAGTSWQVTAINGHPTAPNAGAFKISFADRQFGGRFACNQASGQYRIDGIMLIASRVSATEMACEARTPGGVPLMTFEEWAYRTLRAPMEMRWVTPQRLLLANAAGFIELERAP